MIEAKGLPGRPGQYRGTFHPAKTGQHLVSILGFHDDEAQRRELLVSHPRGEIDTPERNSIALTATVEANHEGQGESGATRPDAEPRGRALETLADLERFPEEVPSKEENFRIYGKRQEIWSSPATLLLFLLLVGTEWFLRKRRNLI